MYTIKKPTPTYTTTLTVLGTAFHITFYYNRKTVSAQLLRAITEELTRATGYLFLPESVNIFLVDTNPQYSGYGRRAQGTYTHDANIHSPARSIRIYTRGITIARIQAVLAHELGHAEHYHLIPESANWDKGQNPSPRKEAYAQTIAEILFHIRLYKIIPQDIHFTQDIYVEERHIHRP